MTSALDGLTDAQRVAVTHGTSPLLVRGGPGTGKTQVLLRRFVHLADGGLAPHRILLLSAQEGLLARVEAALDRPHEELAVRTAPDLSAAVLAAQARHAGIDPFVDVVSAADRLAMLLERADELALTHHDFRGRRIALFAGFIRHIDRLRAELIDAPRCAAWAATVPGPAGAREREFAALFAAHDRMLEERGVYDEGGVLAACLRLLLADAALRERVAARFPVALVDDWQDRSHGERELIAAFEAGGSSLTAAGDDDQAIGLARGAGAGGPERFARRRPRCDRGDAHRDRSLPPGRCSRRRAPWSRRSPRAASTSCTARQAATCASGAPRTSARRPSRSPPSSSA